jgi:hypothetical protein
MACKHNGGNIQQFTEICLDCGVSIYETAEERVRRLQGEVSRARHESLVKEGDALEAELELLRGKPDDTNNGGW